MLRSEYDRYKVIFEVFGIYFNCSSASIYKQYLRLKKDTLPNGRPTILCCEAIEFIKNVKRENFLNKIDQLHMSFFLMQFNIVLFESIKLLLHI